ncbi:MAG: nicotinate-nucleotide diphosphorylase [Planctomycetaceae bacterium]|jgi:nicotinate-nucleotide pyrophosphorylase (carboxylating)|nr:nicotinate-nucleotide diphosphorylase [Planctomycetaceae bacterium]
MKRDFNQIVWDATLETDVRSLIRLAIAEDLDSCGDLTTQALVPQESFGSAVVKTRQDGVVSGLTAIPVITAMTDTRLHWKSAVHDGDTVKQGDILGEIVGPITSILSTERMILNLVGKLSGIATLTHQYVNEVTGTQARVYDTRKTTLGWRRLEKYAVKCGGGQNHRTGLYDAVLIKDNHLAYGASVSDTKNACHPAEAVEKARKWLESTDPELFENHIKKNKHFKNCGIQVLSNASVPKKYKSCGIDVAAKPPLPMIEIEVDSLKQLAEVLPAVPDIVLLDNMSPDQLRQAVQMRNAAGVAVELEASGGITLKTIRDVALTGVERISCGALTHSAVALDIGLDF